MSDDDNRLKELLDGNLSPEEIADDPVLASLAERIYGTDFLDRVGITRGETKRALAEQFSEIDGDDLLIDVLPDGPPLPMPEDMPANPSFDIDDDPSGGGRSIKHKISLIGGLSGLIAVVVNLFYGFGNFLSGCSTEVHSTCSTSMKLNWVEFHRMNEHIAWSPTGSIGIPDVILAVICLCYIVCGLRGRN
jgi:hypothetical protein